MKTQVTPYNTEAGKKKEVEAMFDNIAPQYDFLNRALSLKVDLIWRKNLVNWLKKDQPKTNIRHCHRHRRPRHRYGKRY